MALYFGLDAIFKIFWFGLGIGVILKLISAPFLIIATGYVQISQATSSQIFWTSLVGPLTNLILFIVSMIVLKKVNLTRKQAIGFCF